MGACHGLESIGNLDVQILLSQVYYIYIHLWVDLGVVQGSLGVPKNPLGPLNCHLETIWKGRLKLWRPSKNCERAWNCSIFWEENTRTCVISADYWYSQTKSIFFALHEYLWIFRTGKGLWHLHSSFIFPLSWSQGKHLHSLPFIWSTRWFTAERVNKMMESRGFLRITDH